MQNPADNVDLGTMSESLGFLLRLAQIDAFSRLYADDGLSETTVGELSILHVISRNPGIRQGVVGRTLRIKRAHMTKIVHGIEAKGLLTSTTPPQDRRAVALTLTDAGQSFLHTHWPAVDAREIATTGDLTPREADTLRRLLRKYLGISDPQATREDLAS